MLGHGRKPPRPFSRTALMLPPPQTTPQLAGGRRRRHGPREDVARLVDDQSAARCRAMSRLGCAAEADASPSLLALRLMRANARSLATYSREEWETIPPGGSGIPAGRACRPARRHSHSSRAECIPTGGKTYLPAGMPGGMYSSR